MRYLPVILLAIFLAGSWWLDYLPMFIPAFYALMSLLTLGLYALDKRAARRASRRVAEATLHWQALLCGWPGAIIGQQWLRHKTVKQPFRRIFWATVLLNVAGLAWLHSEPGSRYLNTVVFVLEEHVLNVVPAGSTRDVLIALLAFH